jgi:hypothetical protein
MPRSKATIFSPITLAAPSDFQIIHLTLIGGVALVLALVTAGAAKGVIGVGMPIIAMPPMNHIIDLPTGQPA